MNLLLQYLDEGFQNDAQRRAYFARLQRKPVSAKTQYTFKDNRGLKHTLKKSSEEGQDSFWNISQGSRPVGHLWLRSSRKSKVPPQVHNMGLHSEKDQGKGIAPKVYKLLTHHYGSLRSDSTGDTSWNAVKVWQKIGAQPLRAKFDASGKRIRHPTLGFSHFLTTRKILAKARKTKS